MTALVLVIPDYSKSFKVYCDASLEGLGCVLMSRQLRADEMNYQFTISSSPCCVFHSKAMETLTSWTIVEGLLRTSEFEICFQLEGVKHALKEVS